MLSFFKGEPIEIHRESSTGVKDKYGNYVTSSSVIYATGLLGFRATNEQHDEAGSTSLEEYKIVFDSYTAVEDGDVFVVRGEEFVQDGEPFMVTPAFGGGFLPMPNVINVKRVERNG